MNLLEISEALLKHIADDFSLFKIILFIFIFTSRFPDMLRLASQVSRLGGFSRAWSACRDVHISACVSKEARWESRITEFKDAKNDNVSNKYHLRPEHPPDTTIAYMESESARFLHLLSLFFF